MEELKEALEALAKAFEDFKKLNDERLEQIKAKGHADPLLEAQVNKLDSRISELSDLKTRLEKLEIRSNRIGLTGEQSEQDENRAKHKHAFINGFIRKGITDGLDELQQKAMNVGTPGDGGYAVPEELDRSILELMATMSDLRGICTVITVGSSDYKKLVNLHGASSGWVGETTARSVTNTPSLAEVTPYMGEIYANPSATQRMLDDAFFNAETFIMDEVALEFAQKEGIAFVTGDASNKPKGFLDYTYVPTADSSRTFGQLQYLATGQAGAWPTTNPADKLLDLIQTLKKPLRQGASWCMNGTVLTAIRKFKDENKQYLWMPGLSAGEPSTLFGYPVNEIEAMPDIAANSLSVVFGNMKRGYTIVDRLGTRMLRDPFSNKPYVHFYTTKRVGGMVVDSEAIKALKFAAS